jgi:hypothetical protein
VSADPLSDVLRAVRLDGAHFFTLEASGPWSVEVVAATDLTPRILPGSEHLISYHILTEGRCWGGLVGEPLVELAPGDVIVFPHGDAHVVSSASDMRMRSMRSEGRPPDTLGR